MVSSRNVLIPVIFLLVFGIINMVGAVITISITTTFVSIFPTDTAIAQAAAHFENVYNVLDIVYALIMVILIIGIIVTSYRIKTKSIYAVFILISALFFGFLGYLFSYIFSQIASNPALSTIIYIFNITIMIATNLHWIALILTLVGAIALYAKGDEDGGMEIPLR